MYNITSEQISRIMCFNQSSIRVSMQSLFNADVSYFKLNGNKDARMILHDCIDSVDWNNIRSRHMHLKAYIHSKIDEAHWVGITNDGKLLSVFNGYSIENIDFSPDALHLIKCRFNHLKWQIKFSYDDSDVADIQSRIIQIELIDSLVPDMKLMQFYSVEHRNLKYYSNKISRKIRSIL